MSPASHTYWPDSTCSGSARPPTLPTVIPDDLKRAVEEAHASVCEGSSQAIALLDFLLGRLRCESCGYAWRDPSERWRACVDEELSGLVLLCPDC